MISTEDACKEDFDGKMQPVAKQAGLQSKMTECAISCSLIPWSVW